MTQRLPLARPKRKSAGPLTLADLKAEPVSRLGFLDCPPVPHGLALPSANPCGFSDQEYLDNYRAGKELEKGFCEDLLRSRGTVCLASCPCQLEIGTKLCLRSPEQAHAWSYAVVAVFNELPQSLSAILATESFSPLELNLLLNYSLLMIGDGLTACTKQLLSYGASLDELPQVRRCLYKQLMKQGERLKLNLLMAFGKGPLAHFQEAATERHPLQYALQLLSEGVLPAAGTLNVFELLLQYAAVSSQDNALWRKEGAFRLGRDCAKEDLQGTYPNFYTDYLLRYRPMVYLKCTHEERRTRLLGLCQASQGAQQKAAEFKGCWEQGSGLALRAQVIEALRVYKPQADEIATLGSIQRALGEAQDQKPQQILTQLSSCKDWPEYQALPLNAGLRAFIFFLESSLLKEVREQLLPAPALTFRVNFFRDKSLVAKARALAPSLREAMGPTVPLAVAQIVASYAVPEDRVTRQQRDDLQFLALYQDQSTQLAHPEDSQLSQLCGWLEEEQSLAGEFKQMQTVPRFWEAALCAGVQNYHQSLAEILQGISLSPAEANLLFYWIMEHSSDLSFQESARLALKAGADLKPHWMVSVFTNAIREGQFRKFEFLLGPSPTPFFYFNPEDPLQQGIFLERALASTELAARGLAARGIISGANQEVCVNLLLQLAQAFPDNNQQWIARGQYRLPGSSVTVPRGKSPARSTYPEFYIDYLSKGLLGRYSASLEACDEVLKRQEAFNAAWKAGAEEKDRPADDKSTPTGRSFLRLLALEPKVSDVGARLKALGQSATTEEELLQGLETERRALLQEGKAQGLLSAIIFYTQMKIRQQRWLELRALVRPEVGMAKKA